MFTGYAKRAKPDAGTQARLDACVLDERTRRKTPGGDSDREGYRGSTSEDSSMSYGGRPRGVKPRRRPAQTRFASYHTWKG